MTISFENVDGVGLAHVSGRIDGITSGNLEEDLLAFIDKSPARVVVDLQRTSFVSSAGLRVFILAARRLRERGMRLGVRNMNREVRETFELTRLDLMMDLSGDLTDVSATDQVATARTEAG